MSDLDRADRELEALGPVPAKLSELLARYGLRDRSLENVDEALVGLSNGHDYDRPTTETLVDRPSFLPLGWDQKELVPDAASVAPAVELRDEITVTSPAPEPEEPPLTTSQRAQLDAEPALETSRSLEPRSSLEPQATFAAPVPEPAMFSSGPISELGEPQEHIAPRSTRPSRPDLQALLDEELDPREFPSSRPPAMLSSRPAVIVPASPVPALPQASLPPVPRTSQAPFEETQPEPANADFELLVDDDDILEIDE